MENQTPSNEISSSTPSPTPVESGVPSSNPAPAPIHSSEIQTGATAPVQALCTAIRNEVKKAVVGQDEVIGQFLIAILVGGHVLLEGVPGVAKTLSSRALAASIGATFKRIQFTPDLMPSDVTGTSVFNMRTQEFSLQKGPIFTDLLLADEINRTPPKTQAALLEAMQERSVTIEGESHQLSPLFTVFATQNPLDYEGTYPLPEAQVDRFLLKILVDYPSPEAEMALLDRIHRGFDAHQLEGIQGIASEEMVLKARAAVKAVKVSEGMVRYIYQIVARTRSLATLTLGASPRAGIALLESSKALAAMNGRDYIIPEDVKAVAPPVLRHRLLLRAESEMEGLRPDDIVKSVLGMVEVPR
jgi:MoxR-like ATPase